MAKTPTTYSEVVQARIDRSIADGVKVRAEIAERERIQGILDANGQIGLLMRKGALVYYVNFPVYREAVDPAQLVEG